MGHGQGITPPQTTQQKLRAALDHRAWGVRTLARQMAEREGQPQRTESIRRQLKRYLSATETVVPSTTTRQTMEDVLGLERDSLLADEDDAEAAEPMAQFMAPLLAALKPMLRAVASEVYAEQMRETT